MKIVDRGKRYHWSARVKSGTTNYGIPSWDQWRVTGARTVFDKKWVHRARVLYNRACWIRYNGNDHHVLVCPSNWASVRLYFWALAPQEDANTTRYETCLRSQEEAGIDQQLIRVIQWKYTISYVLSQKPVWASSVNVSSCDFQYQWEKKVEEQDGGTQIFELKARRMINK